MPRPGGEVCGPVGAIEGLRRTPHNTIQYANEIAKDVTIDVSRDIPHQKCDVDGGTTPWLWR